MRRLVQGLVVLVLTTTPHPPPPYRFVPDVPIVPGMTLSFGGAEFTCTTVLASIGADPLGDPIAVQPDGTFEAKDVVIPVDVRHGPNRLEVSCIDDQNEYQSTDVQVVGPTSRQRIALSPGSVQPGAVVTVDGTAFDDCIDDFTTHDGTPTPVQASITLDSTVVGAVPVTDGGPAAGTFRTTFTVPTDISSGDHQVAALCRNRFLPGSSAATATLTVGSAPGPSTTPGPPPGGGGGGDPGTSQRGGQGSGGSAPQTNGPAGGIVLVGIIAVVAAIGLVALRRRLRLAGAPVPIPPRSPGSQRLPDVVARSAGLSSGPIQISPGPGQDVSVRVVAHSGGPR